MRKTLYYCINTQRINSCGTEEGTGEHYTIETSVLIARIRASLLQYNSTITTYFELIYDICRITSEVIQTITNYFWFRIIFHRGGGSERISPFTSHRTTRLRNARTHGYLWLCAIRAISIFAGSLQKAKRKFVNSIMYANYSNLKEKIFIQISRDARTVRYPLRSLRTTSF
jgi:hypothetical protein